MYKLTFSPGCFDVSGDKILLSGKNSGHLFEISMFRIPAKLMTTNPEEEGMTKDRDFCLVAGINDQTSSFLQVCHRHLRKID
jgi:hypothetical protein